MRLSTSEPQEPATAGAEHAKKPSQCAKHLARTVCLSLFSFGTAWCRTNGARRFAGAGSEGCKYCCCRRSHGCVFSSAAPACGRFGRDAFFWATAACQRTAQSRCGQADSSRCLQNRWKRLPPLPPQARAIPTGRWLFADGCRGEMLVPSCQGRRPRRCL